MAIDQQRWTMQCGICLFTMVSMVGGCSPLSVGAQVKKEPSYTVVREQVYGEKFFETHQLMPTDDGGYAIAGASFPLTGAYVIKTNAEGAVEWAQSFVGPKPVPQEHRANCVVQTTDGGYLLAGSTNSDATTGVQMGETADPRSPRRKSAALVVKYDRQGTLVWKKTLMGPSWHNQLFRGLAVGDGYILIGSTSRALFDQPTPNGKGVTLPLWVIKLNEAGEVVWERVFSDELFNVYGGSALYGKPFLDHGGHIVIAVAAREMFERSPTGTLQGRPAGTPMVAYTVLLTLNPDGRELQRVTLPSATQLAVTPSPDGYVLSGFDAFKTRTWFLALDEGLHTRVDTPVDAGAFRIYGMIPDGVQGGFHVVGSHRSGDAIFKAAIAYMTKEGTFQDEFILPGDYYHALDVVPGKTAHEVVVLVSSGFGGPPGAALMTVRRR